jgi:hypothetical protein
MARPMEILPMTESEWLQQADPRPMLEALRGRASERKLRLFGIACCRRIWHLLRDERCRLAVLVAEQFAERIVRDGARKAARAEALQAAPPISEFSAARKAVLAVCALLDGQAYFAALTASNDAAATLLQTDRIAEEKKVQADLLRDILGYPFAPVSLDPAWLAWNNGTIVALARSIEEENAWDQAPILGDALEEVGCTNQRILDHLRCPGPHVRGCWCVDLVLAKDRESNSR